MEIIILKILSVIFVMLSIVYIAIRNTKKESSSIKTLSIQSKKKKKSIINTSRNRKNKQREYIEAIWNEVK